MPYHVYNVSPHKINYVYSGKHAMVTDSTFQFFIQYDRLFKKIPIFHSLHNFNKILPNLDFFCSKKCTWLDISIWIIVRLPKSFRLRTSRFYGTTPHFVSRSLLVIHFVTSDKKTKYRKTQNERSSPKWRMKKVSLFATENTL